MENLLAEIGRQIQITPDASWSPEVNNFNLKLQDHLLQTSSQPTDDDLFICLESVTPKDSFEITHDPYILPLSVHEVWQNFFMDDAVYSMDKAALHSYELEDRTIWQTPDKEDIDG